jgi:tetratricopeptide (TPR) repeat protein
MDPEVNEAALAALERAKSLAAKASPRERGLVAALDERYGRGAGAERAVLDRAYADAMTELARRHPQDLDIATLAAEALMDLSPWDYWEPGGAKGKGRTDELVALLEGVLARNPEHPGAIHLYIHAVEASDRPERAEPYADRLARQNLGTGHLVHMPSHVYYRVGRYRDALETNRRAAAVDEAFLARAPGGAYGAAYYPHNVHFLLVSAQMSGDGPGAIAAAEKLATVISDEAAAKIPMVQPIKAAPLFAHAQFSSPEVVLALPRPSGGFAYVDALWHYARGIAKAASGDLDGARAEAEVLAGIGGGGDLAALTKAGIPAPLVLRLAHHVVLARIAQAEGEHGRALTEWQAASAIEAQLPYMEPPYWYFPVGQSLGAAHLRLGNLDEAEAAFRDSLRKTPNNGLALFGLGEVLKARGDVAGAEKAARGLAAAWAGQGAGLDLGRL